MRSRFTLLLLTIAIALITFSACGRRQRNQEQQPDYTTHISSNAIQLPPGAHSLTISACLLTNETRIRQAGENLRTTLAAQGIDLELIILDYMLGDAENHYAQMLSQLAAGRGPDIIAWGMMHPPAYPFRK